MNFLIKKHLTAVIALIFFMSIACTESQEPDIEEDLIEVNDPDPDPQSGEEEKPTANPFDREGHVYLHQGEWIVLIDADTVHKGNDMLRAIQHATNGLFAVRDRKQTVFVHHSGETGPSGGSIKAIDIPSFTTLDFQGNTIHVNDTGDDLIVPIRGLSTQNIEVKNLKITGNPRYGIWLQSCRNIVLTNIHISIPEAENIGLGIRVDHSRGGRSVNVYMDSIYVEKSKHHGVETFGVDGLTIGTITTRETGGAGLLLNDTRDGTVKLVDAYRANNGGGYAGFRTANNCGPNIIVGKVIAVDCGRGVFSVSGSRGITIREVDISGSTSHGVLIEDTQDYVIEGGIIKNSGAQGLRIASRSSTEHHASSNVTVKNLRIYDDRNPKVQSHGIWETLPRTNNNFIIDNDLRGSGSTANLIYEGTGTKAEGNIVE